MGCCPSKQEKGYIYRLPKENYVGQTIQNPSTRWKQHEKAGKNISGASVIKVVRL
jgi:hypothetical protein